MYTYQVLNAVRDSKGVSHQRDGSLQTGPVRTLKCPPASYLRHSESPPHLNNQRNLPMMPLWQWKRENAHHHRDTESPAHKALLTPGRILHQKWSAGGRPMWGTVLILPTKHCTSGRYQTLPIFTDPLHDSIQSRQACIM